MNDFYDLPKNSAIGYSTVKVKFADKNDAMDFKDEVKQKFDFPKTSSKYQVAHGKSRSGKAVFVETSKLFGKALREASKERFIKKLYNDYNRDIYGPHNGPCPTTEVLTKFVDGPGSNKGYDWNKLDLNLLRTICNDYWTWKANGGSRKNRDAQAKIDPRQVFMKSGLKIIEEDFSESEAEDAEMIHLGSLDNEDFLFFMPLTYKCCVWMDSFQCGGEGAKWCIGYERTDNYWRDYVRVGNLFVLAFNKKAFANPNRPKDKLKYMLQLNPDDEKETQAWEQSDCQFSTILARQFYQYFKLNPKDAFNTVSRMYNRLQDASYEGDSVIMRKMDDWYQDEWYQLESNSNFQGYKFENNIISIEDALKSKDWLESLKHLDEITIEGRDSTVRLDDTLYGGSNSRFDVPSFFEELRSIGANIKTVYFKNLYVPELYYEPEASPYKADIIFDHCTIDDLYFTDYSDGKYALRAVNRSEIGTVYWPEEGSGYLVKTLILDKSSSITYEEIQEPYDD